MQSKKKKIAPALDPPLGRDFILDEVKIQLDRYLRSINVIHKVQSEIANIAYQY